jgi:hypothetical protein
MNSAIAGNRSAVFIIYAMSRHATTGVAVARLPASSLLTLFSRDAVLPDRRVEDVHGRAHLNRFPHPALRHAAARGVALCAALLAVLAGCTVPPRAPAVDPDAVRTKIRSLMPASLANADGWAIDIYAAFEALQIPPDTRNICAVLAVTEQESGFQVDPAVPDLPAIARREIDERAASRHIPKLMVSAALKLESPDGRTYGERLARARTERDLSELFEDFTRSVPLGERLFGGLNPVRTGGPMQVSIAFAQRHADERRYPYPVTGNVRNEVFTRRGGLYFGIAHLLDYDAPYDQMVFRFADFNAGHFASRNAAFQNAVNIVAGKRLALDGDLLIEGTDDPSATELAVRSIRSRLGLSDAQIRKALEQGRGKEFEQTAVYADIMRLADAVPPGRPVPRAMVPRIALESPKITRNLTTEWFARRVEERFKRCLARAG